MTDLHTHILPEMDDGSKSVEESLALLQTEREQGVDTVFLTSHFYRWQEPAGAFLERRRQAFDKLCAALPPDAPSLLLGAEVAWFPSLAEEPLLERLCLGESRYFLLELPFERWHTRLLDRLYDLNCATGLTPVLAHVERYLPLQSREQMEELTSMGLPMQMNADSLLNWRRRKRCLKLLSRGEWHLSSDCHNVDKRPPRLGQAIQYLNGKWGAERTARLTEWTPGAVLEKELS